MAEKKNPYAGTQTEKNLLAAFAGESEATNKYTYFASRAKKDGYEQIAALFLMTASNEREHAKLWFKALGCLSDPQGDVPIGHDLLALFNGLSQEIQDALIARCGQPRAYFLNVLQEDAKTFEVWRYAYEQQALQADSSDGLIVMSIPRLLTDALPMACDRVYEDFKAF